MKQRVGRWSETSGSRRVPAWCENGRSIADGGTVNPSRIEALTVSTEEPGASKVTGTPSIWKRMQRQRYEMAQAVRRSRPGPEDGCAGAVT